MGNCVCCGNNNSNNDEYIEKQKEMNLQNELKDIELNVLQQQNKKKYLEL